MMAEKCDYHALLEETANLIAERIYDQQSGPAFNNSGLSVS
jgi:hypothetical protein